MVEGCTSAAAVVLPQHAHRLKNGLDDDARSLAARSPHARTEKCVAFLENFVDGTTGEAKYMRQLVRGLVVWAARMRGDPPAIILKVWDPRRPCPRRLRAAAGGNRQPPAQGPGGRTR